jgi:hypothetical protein
MSTTKKFVVISHEQNRAGQVWSRHSTRALAEAAKRKYEAKNGTIGSGREHTSGFSIRAVADR